jgi:PBP1b-binding outer membrane lipoprotein LpoB
MKIIKLFSIACMATLISCSAGKTNRVAIDTDEPFSDVETSSKDLEAVAQKMSASLLQLSQIGQATTPVRIAFSDVKNETNEIINKNLFIEKMRTLLLKNARGKMIFLDREISEDIAKEREQKRAGEVSSTSSKIKSGADYFLTGKLSEQSMLSARISFANLL